MKKDAKKTTKALMQGKRADISITILVFMTLVVIGMTLFLFIANQNSINKKISNAKFLENAYAIEDKIFFYLRDAAGSAAIEAYENMAEQKEFIMDGCPSPNGADKDFCNAANINDRFKEEFIKNLKENVDALQFSDEEDIMNNFKKHIAGGKFSAEFDGKDFKIALDEFRIYASIAVEKTRAIFFVVLGGTGEAEILIYSTYSPEIEIQASLLDSGLTDFNSIYGIVDECARENALGSCQQSNGEGIRNRFIACLNSKLENFESFAENRCINNNSYFLVTMKTKSEFLINSKLQNIEIKFLKNAGSA